MEMVVVMVVDGDGDGGGDGGGDGDVDGDGKSTFNSWVCAKLIPCFQYNFSSTMRRTRRRNLYMTRTLIIHPHPHPKPSQRGTVQLHTLLIDIPYFNYYMDDGS